MSDTHEEFIRLCDRVREKEALTCGVNEIEPELLKVLMFIKEHHSETEFFKNFILKIMVDKSPYYPHEIVVFCMRELQWSEVSRLAKLEKDKADDWRVIAIMDTILEVYDVEWEDADMYEYYSKS